MTHRSNGRLTARTFRRPQTTIREDTFMHVRVFRGRRGSETPVASFSTRIAPVSASSLGRERRTALGDSAAQVFVMQVPRGADVVSQDEVWADSDRWRVFAVDHLASGTQAILQKIV